jgi:hypothetical protein
MSDHPIEFWAAAIGLGVLFLLVFTATRARRELRALSQAPVTPQSAALLRKRRRGFIGDMFLVIVGGFALLGMFVGFLASATGSGGRLGALAGLAAGLLAFSALMARVRRSLKTARTQPPTPPLAPT